MYQRQVTFQEAVEKALKQNYCNFSGRASRSEFWWFELFMWLVNIAVGIIGLLLGDTGSTVLSSLVSLALLLPTLGLMARRLHDTGKSGWWLLLILTGIGVILLIIWWILPSEEHPNEYGAEPNMVF